MGTGMFEPDAASKETPDISSLLQPQDANLLLSSICACTDGRFKEAAEFYEPLVQSKLDDLLSVPAIVLANLCVCYIMTSQNDQAEALMRQVERQEQQQATAVSHLALYLSTVQLKYLIQYI